MRLRNGSGIRGVALFVGLLLCGGLTTGTVHPPAPPPAGQLRVDVLDAATGKPTPVRIRLTRVGKPVPVIADGAIAVSYGLWDHADGYAFQPDSSFYVAGTFSLPLPSGKYNLIIQKGNEYLQQSHQLIIRAGQTLRKTYRMSRWIDMTARKWFSADGHIHVRRSPRDNQPLLSWIRAEDINVGVLLKMGDFWATYYPQYAFGQAGSYQRGNVLLAAGQEDPRTPELGHALGYGASAAVRYGSEYYYYDKVFDELHRRGGLTGYAHQAESFHGYRGLTLDGLRGKVDALELIQYCVSEQPLHTEHYYRMLDLGIPMTATAGSDFPWCGHDHDHGPPERSARIGNARFYTYIDGPLSLRAWRAGLAAGHTFATTGPMLNLRVNNARPGDQLALKKGESLTITAEADGHPEQVPLDTLELVAHGRVLARATKNQPGQSARHLTVKLTLTNIERGVWIAARCFGGTGQAAHTTPVYVRVDGGGFHNPETAMAYLRQSEAYLRELEQELDTHRDNPEFRAWYFKKGLRTRIDETRLVIADLKTRLTD